MNTIVDEIYKLTYSPLLTPYNLLDNLNLENYITINYSKVDNNILSEIVCLIDDVKMNFYYLFDEQQFLKEIYYFENEVKHFLFNREFALEEARLEYTSINSNEEKCS
ncbi:hypothetical protein C0L85_03870 [Clostridium perfringens]|uniref:hypothetical protein n=1 Tax=Clostridium perfringens TaxID=1502 RepID=UPI001A21980E|nr:hypothetical protein [Clostridium perfringens]